MEGMFQYHNRTIYYCTMKKYKAVKQRGRVKAGAERKITVLQDLVITFTDLGLKNQEIKDYNERIERGCKGYTFVDFQEKEVRMGTLTLRTDMDLKAQKLYETYREIPTKISIDKLRNIFSEEMKRIVPENRVKRTNTFNREGD